MISLLHQLMAMLSIATSINAFEIPLSRSRLRSPNPRHRDVANTRRQLPAAGFSYVSCVTDGEARALTGTKPTWSNDMTPEKCIETCTAGDFTYAGLQFGDQCWCGNSLANNLGKTAPESECSMACVGDKSAKCGGKFRLSLYVSAEEYKPTDLGCYADTGADNGASRTLMGTFQESSSMTPTVCYNFCRAGGYRYAGLEYGRQCYCGNSLDQSRRQPSSACSMACAGDSRSTCGGTWRINVIQISGPPTTTTATSTIATSTTSTLPSATTSVAPIPSASQIGVSSPPSASGTKWVWAHHMVGNTYSYTRSIWADDIRLAAANGIDGFALNMGRDSWEPARVADAYAAAEAQGNFKLFFSFDVSSLGCSTTNDAVNLANTITTYANSTAQAMYKGKTLVSTFAGEQCRFGQSSNNAGWAYLRTLLDLKKVEVYMMPAIFSDPAGFKNMDWMDGEFNWNGGWPMGSTPLDTSSDEQYMSALGTKGYMPAMSPSFFTYYGVNSYNKNWIYRGDDWLLARRMEQVIAMRNKVDMVEIISWNDYGESHYIGPIRVDQPNSQGWTNGMDHQGWLSIIKIYSAAFKTGRYPGNTDSITVWSRPHPKGATATAPSNPRPSGWEKTDDNLYVFITVTNPSTITIWSGNNTATWSYIYPGINKFSIGNGAGSIGAKIVRNGRTIKEYDSGDDFTYTMTPRDYNFNYFVGSA